MSASRWYTGTLEVSEWLQDKSIKDLLLPSIFTRLQKKDDQDKDPASSVPAGEEPVKYPEVLPILPLRGVVVYPQTAVPLTIGQTRYLSRRENLSAWLRRVIRRLKNPVRRISMQLAPSRPFINCSVSPIIPSACWYRVWRVSV